MISAYSEADTIIVGRRLICHTDGHKIITSSSVGGIPIWKRTKIEEHQGYPTSAADDLECANCDVVFTATYPPLKVARVPVTEFAVRD